MTLSDLLLGASIFSLAWIIPIVVLLIREARKKPHIWALTLFTYVCACIAALVVSYVAAASNAAAGSPIPPDALRVLFRAVALILGLFPPLFWWVYRTGRFRDGGAAIDIDPERMARAIYSIGWIGGWEDRGAVIPFSALSEANRAQMIESAGAIIGTYSRGRP